jgi:thiol-disulfide isomerase/thioredoxin
MVEVIIWTATWCAPCKGLKNWTDIYYPFVVYKDIEKDVAPFEIKSVPTMQIGQVFIPNVSTIKQHLSKRGSDLNRN